MYKKLNNTKRVDSRNIHLLLLLSKVQLVAEDEGGPRIIA